MSRFWSDIVHKLTPYVPGEQPKMANLVKLNTNENPYGPSPKVIKAIAAHNTDALRLYPDPHSSKLISALAKKHNLDENQVFVGNGSDEVLAHCFRALLKQSKPLLFPETTYSFYPVYANLFEINFQQPGLRPDMSLGLDHYNHENGGIIFPNPNAPTGKLESLETIRALLNRNKDSVVVVDEAYIDFGGESAVSLINEFDNLMVIQTFSKSRALAGLRIGYALAQSHLIDALVRVKDSFNSYPMDQLAIAAGVASLEDDDYFIESNRKVIADREWTSAQLNELGFDIIPSAANFVFAKPTSMSAEQLFTQLRERGVIVRWFNKEGISDYLRISIGTHDEMEQFISTTKEILAK
jgi:histidinol-phosphate aminotransferase